VDQRPSPRVAQVIAPPVGRLFQAVRRSVDGLEKPSYRGAHSLHTDTIRPAEARNFNFYSCSESSGFAVCVGDQADWQSGASVLGQSLSEKPVAARFQRAGSRKNRSIGTLETCRHRQVTARTADTTNNRRTRCTTARHRAGGASAAGVCLLWHAPRKRSTRWQNRPGCPGRFAGSGRSCREP
jgi:hypothetical protein